MPQQPKPAELKPLQPKQRIFVAHYIIHLNAHRAAKAAGYRHPQQECHRTLHLPHVQAAIEAAKADQMKRLQITGDDVVRELCRVAFANISDFFRLVQGTDPAVDLADMSREEAAALTSIQVEDFVDGRGEDAREVRRVKITMADKVKALELLCRHFGLLDDRMTVRMPGLEALRKEIGDLSPTEAAAEYQRMISHVAD